jgi:hypothetical protein
MPSIRIVTSPLPQHVKDAIAQSCTAALRGVLNAPSIEVFFQESSDIYVNGKRVQGTTTALYLEGPAIGRPQMEQVCALLHHAVEHSVPDTAVTFVYHVNDYEHVGADGILLAARRAQQPTP